MAARELQSEKDDLAVHPLTLLAFAAVAAVCIAAALAAGLPLPGSAWWPAAKIGGTALHAPLQPLGGYVAAALLAALGLAACAFWMLRARAELAYQGYRAQLQNRRLAHGLELHEEMTRNMQEGLTIVRDRDGIVVHANPRAEAMFGYPPGEMPGHHVSCMNARAGGDPHETAARITLELRRTGAWSGEILNARRDGAPFWCKTTVSGIEHPDHGKVWLVIHTDITALKNLEIEQHQHLERISQLGHHLVAVQETERRKLGAELHDRTGANLAAARLLLKEIAALSAGVGSAALTHKMEDLQALIVDTDVTIRDISGSLRPPLLDFLGLTATLQSLAGKVEKNSGMKVAVRNRQVPRLDADAETLLYRIVQEALTNCARHSHATCVDVDLSLSGDCVLLSVADNGIGFEAAAPARSEGLGLLTMRERAEFADGAMVVESTLGHGTTVRVVMPRTPRAGDAAREGSRLAALSVVAGG